jgi:hypothetical protein
MMSRHRVLAPAFALAAAALVGCGGEDPTSSSDEQLQTEGRPLEFVEYDVRFTNPECALYEYDQEVLSERGDKLTAKPKNVFCTQNDSAASGSRPESPQTKLLEWINSEETKEIFFTYLSFSNSTVQKAVCKAITERNVKVTFVLDSGSDTAKADALLACQPSDPANKPRFEKRGHTPGIGYAHNKMFLINPGAETMKIAFSSGNMSSGVVLHHENWHFITLASKTYFAQAHLCMMNAELDGYQSKTAYRDYIEGCLADIEAKEESDIKAFFIPADRGRASKQLISAIGQAETIDIAAHRFSYTKMVSALKQTIDENDTPVRVVADDDMYWAGQGQQVGDNLSFEFYNVKGLTNRGAEARWMETNHDAHLLHHNKFLVFDMPEGENDAVWCGAGNLTGTGFNENWENYYYVTIPEVVEAYKKQFGHMWEDLATDSGDMPTENILPIPSSH